AEEIAQGLAGSITMGVGQFCTNPGVVVGVRGDALQGFSRLLGERIEASSPGPMLYGQICSSYSAGVAALRNNPAVRLVGEAAEEGAAERFGRPAVFVTSARAFLEQPELRHEVFGPSSLLVEAEDEGELLEVALGLEGPLTATIHATPEELAGQGELVKALEDRAGRLIFNGYPTGVEVAHAMQHGGPYPATTSPGTTSVGTAAITRFVRPVAYQSFPDGALPAELRNGNPRGIWRLVDGEVTRAEVG